MYDACLFCGTAFRRNRVLAQLPLGRSVAYDPRQVSAGASCRWRRAGRPFRNWSVFTRARAPRQPPMAWPDSDTEGSRSCDLASRVVEMKPGCATVAHSGFVDSFTAQPLLDF
jgi:hypothetical protein